MGSAKRVIAFCTDDKAAEAKEAGAIEAGGEELVKKIEGGWMDFDVAVATPDMMRVISKLGRVLGPSGLMPSPKAGTVTDNVVGKTVTDYSAGKVEYRNDAGGNIHAVIGKMSRSTSMPTSPRTPTSSSSRPSRNQRPSAVKGQYIKKISMSAAP